MVYITCKSRGDPTPTVTWKWNDQQNITHVQFRANGATLVIEALDESLVGKYQCLVKNAVGFDSAKILVNVFGKILLHQSTFPN